MSTFLRIFQKNVVKYNQTVEKLNGCSKISKSFDQAFSKACGFLRQRRTSQRRWEVHAHPQSAKFALPICGSADFTESRGTYFPPMAGSTWSLSAESETLFVHFAISADFFDRLIKYNTVLLQLRTIPQLAYTALADIFAAELF